jgi:hypothetical protein
VRPAKKLKNEASLIVQWAGVNLRTELDRIPLWRGNHVSLKQLAEDLARYLYLPRLRDENVLLATVRDGVERLTWQTETFGYAEGWDEKRNRYRGLKAGQPTRVLLDGESLLVKPEVAAAQFAVEQPESTTSGVSSGGGASASSLGVTAPTDMRGGGGAVVPPRPPQYRRFHGSVALDPLRLGRDAARIAEEVVQHLTGLVGAEVRITLEIHADLPEAAPDKLVRDVTENCRTLRFDSQGFEEV